MPDDQPQPDRPKPRAKMIDVTHKAKALTITGQSKPDEPAERWSGPRNVTGTAEGGDLQIVGSGPPLERIQLKPGATAKEIAEAIQAHAKRDDEGHAEG